MLLLKTKLVIVCTNVIFNNGQNAQFKNFRSCSDQSYWTIIVYLSLVSPVLFLIIGTLSVFMKSDGKYLWKIKQLNKIDKIT